MFAALTLDRANDVPSRRTLKTVVCGLGPRGLEYVELLKDAPGFELIGLCDISTERLSTVADAPGIQRSTRLSTLLDSATPDVVVLATPPRMRADLVRCIAQYRGVRAIVIEKPLALTIGEADEILALCHEREILPFVFHQLRHCPEFARLRAVIGDGALGTLERLEVSCFGKLYDQGSHLIDLLTWLLPEHKPLWVEATACDDLKQIADSVSLPPFFTRDSKHPGAAWTSAVLALTGGLRAELQCGPRAPLTRPELGPWMHKRVIAHGTAGVAEAHVSSHFGIFDRNTGRTHEEPSARDSYQTAQLQVYAAVRSALANYSPDTHDSSDLRQTVEILQACEISSTQGTRITLPLPTDMAGLPTTTCPTWPEATAATSRQPRVSIIVPMRDHRGMALPAVHSWANQQSCSPDDYQLVVVLDETVRHLEEPIRAILRQNDRLIWSEGVELEQYHAGARVADGDLLFFTEPHCLAEPEAVAQFIDFMDTHPVDGVCTRTVPICVNAMGRAESRMFDEGFVEWSKPEHWVKVIIRGFGIRKASYDAIGGFRFEYDRFAEWLMAARLRSKGYEMAYAPAVGVRHRYGDNFRLFDEDIREFTDGECLFRIQSDENELIRDYFGQPPEWAEALSARYTPSLLPIQPLLRRFLTSGDRIETPLGRKTCLRLIVHWGLTRLLAKPRLQSKHQAAVWLAQLRYWLSLTDNQRFEAFRDYYMATTSLSRVDFAFNHRNAKVAKIERQRYEMTDLDEHDLWGFSNLEAHQGEQFRWSQPFAAVRLRLIPADYQGVIHLAGVRLIDPRVDLSLFLNHRRLRPAVFDPNTWTLQFELPKSAFHGGGQQWLVVHVTRWTHADVLKSDIRQLGLPVRSVQFRHRL